jgi:hypothetical protein
LEALKGERKVLREGMEELKKKLYERLGNSINLEE